MTTLVRNDVLSRIKDPALKGRWVALIGQPAAPSFVNVEAITASFTKTASQPRFYQGMSLDFPGFSSVDAVAVSLYETDDYAITKWLQMWRMQIFNPETGIYGRPTQYRRNVEVMLFGLTNSESPIATIKLKGCWPSDQQPLEYTYSEPDGRVVVQAQLAVNTMAFETANPT